MTKAQRNHDKERFSNMRGTILKRDKYQCVMCGMTNKEHNAKWKRDLSIDHINNKGRYSDIQDNNKKNLVTLCLSCHGRKDVYKRINVSIYYQYVHLLSLYTGAI